MTEFQKRGLQPSCEVQTHSVVFVAMYSYYSKNCKVLVSM